MGSGHGWSDMILGTPAGSGSCPHLSGPGSCPVCSGLGSGQTPSGPSGLVLGSGADLCGGRVWARITGYSGGGRHSWVEIERGPFGIWTDKEDGRSSASSWLANEANGRRVPTDTRVRLVGAGSQAGGGSGADGCEYAFSYCCGVRSGSSGSGSGGSSGPAGPRIFDVCGCESVASVLNVNLTNFEDLNCSPGDPKVYCDTVQTAPIVFEYNEDDGSWYLQGFPVVGGEIDFNGYDCDEVPHIHGVCPENPSAENARVMPYKLTCPLSSAGNWVVTYAFCNNCLSGSMTGCITWPSSFGGGLLTSDDQCAPFRLRFVQGFSVNILGCANTNNVCCVGLEITE